MTAVVIHFSWCSDALPISLAPFQISLSVSCEHHQAVETSIRCLCNTRLHHPSLTVTQVETEIGETESHG